MRVIFMGSPEFSVPSLEALIGSSHEVVSVYSQPPRPKGRGKAEKTTAVHACAEAAGIDVYTPLNFKDENDIQAFAALDADVAVVIAYGLLLPGSILNAPRLGCVNLHASLLPRWRGAAPIHRSIMAGDKKTGVCLMQMEEGLDTGPVLAKREIPIEPMMTSGDLHDALAQLSAQVLMQNLEDLEQLHPEVQSETGVLYAEKISKEEALIDWSRSSHDLQNFIHGLSPYPGAWAELDGERIKFHRVECVEAQGLAGEVFDDEFTIACGQGAIRPLEIQRAGKRAMSKDEALRGMEKLKGKILKGKT